MKKTTIAIWSISNLAAILAVHQTILLPSESGKARLLNLSVQRLALIIPPGAWVLFSLVAVLALTLRPQACEWMITWLHERTRRSAMISGSVAFWAAIFLGGSVAFFHWAIVPNVTALTLQQGIYFPILYGYLERFWPFLSCAAVWLACWSLYILLGLKIPFYKSTWLQINVAAGTFALFALLLQWIVFAFQLPFFENIPGWYWPVMRKADMAGHAVLFGWIAVALILCVAAIQRFPRASILHLALIAVIFIGLQTTIGHMEGRGVVSLADRFFLSYHRIYTEVACNANYPATEAITHYEDRYPSMFLQTKPPGVLWLAFQVKNIASLPVLSGLLDSVSGNIQLAKHLPNMVSRDCRRSMALVTLFFPLLSTAVIWVLSWFTRRFTESDEASPTAAYSALFYILAPNIVMLPLFLDQALYPTLFLLLAGEIFLALRRNARVASFLVGAVLYGSIFLSFSLLPLLAIPIVYFCLRSWQEKALAAFWTNFKNGLLPMGLGGLFSMLLFKVLLNYDIVVRFQHMLTTRIEGDFYTRFGTHSSGDPGLLTKLQQTWAAAKLNNVELAVAIGIPVFIFFVIMGLRSLICVMRRSARETEVVNASFFLSYVALNGIGVVLGEVARLWMFWAPVMAWMTAQYLAPVLRRRRWVVYGMIGILLINLFLTYQFQDYLMPQLLP